MTKEANAPPGLLASIARQSAATLIATALLPLLGLVVLFFPTATMGWLILLLGTCMLLFRLRRTVIVVANRSESVERRLDEQGIIGPPTFESRHVYSAPKRRAARITYDVTALAIVGALAFGIARPYLFREGDTRILVLQLSGPDEEYGLSAYIVRSLQDAFAGANVSVELVAPSTPMVNRESAVQLATLRNADFLIWGSYHVTAGTVLVTLNAAPTAHVARASAEALSVVLQKALPAPARYPLAAINQFDLHAEAATRVAEIVALAVGTINAGAGRFEEAESAFARVIDGHPSEPMREHCLHRRAMVRVALFDWDGAIDDLVAVGETKDEEIRATRILLTVWARALKMVPEFQWILSDWNPPKLTDATKEAKDLFAEIDRPTVRTADAVIGVLLAAGMLDDAQRVVAKSDQLYPRSLAILTDKIVLHKLQKEYLSALLLEGQADSRESDAAGLERQMFHYVLSSVLLDTRGGRQRAGEEAAEAVRIACRDRSPARHFRCGSANLWLAYVYRTQGDMLRRFRALMYGTDELLKWHSSLGARADRVDRVFLTTLSASLAEMAGAEWEAGDQADAIATINEAVRLDPTFGSARMLRALMQFKTAPFDSWRDLDAVLAQNPTDAEALMTRAYLRHRLGHSEPALADARSYCALSGVRRDFCDEVLKRGEWSEFTWTITGRKVPCGRCVAPGATN
jgi:tetratricopeptide (TPR) repeat protein